MPVPSANITEVPASVGIAPSSSTKTCGFFGCSSKGPLFMPQAFGGGDITDLPSTFGSGPAVKEKPVADQADAAPTGFVPDAVWTEGNVMVGGAKIDYCGVAGTLVVHPAGWDDSGLAVSRAGKDEDQAAAKLPEAQAAMFYVAYFRRDRALTPRPITFLSWL